MLNLRQLIDFGLRGRHRLESIKLLPLGSTLKNAIALYGQPFESKPSEETPEITHHTFLVGPYHEVLAVEWTGTIHSITYWSAKSDPARDLRCVMEFHKDGSQWSEMQAGYWYQCANGKIRLWCSAIPAIGVAYTDFLAIKAQFKTAHHLRQIDELRDITWIANDAVSELQRQFIETGSEALFKLSSRSEKIAVSPDGRHIFIVRQHHTWNVGEGFMEMNKPPESETAARTQVINCFSWDEHGSSWGKITLPRNANVEFIGFEGELCRLQIRQTTTGQILALRGTPDAIERLRVISLLGPHDDAALWQRLQKEAQDFHS